jgi:hypothetical protein
LGQAADSQTVCNRFSSTIALSFWYGSPVGSLTFSQDGLVETFIFSSDLRSTSF